MTQHYPILKIVGDVDDDGSDETGIFEMPNSTVTAGTLTEFLAQFGGGGGIASAVTAEVIGDGPGSGQIAIDGNSGPKTFEIEFTGWTDSGSYQWGSSASTSLSSTSATGQDRISQASMINEWIDNVKIGSNNPALLYWGEYSTSTTFAADGVFEPVPVSIPQSNFPVPHNETSSTYQGTMTCVATKDISEIIDGAEIPV